MNFLSLLLNAQDILFKEIKFLTIKDALIHKILTLILSLCLSAMNYLINKQ